MLTIHVGYCACYVNTENRPRPTENVSAANLALLDLSDAVDMGEAYISSN